jgi:hypothetical protein
MSKESWVDKNHVRVTSDDGRTSYLYKVDMFGRRTCVEVTEHNSDGTTDAYEKGGILDDIFWGGKGKHK